MQKATDDVPTWGIEIGSLRAWDVQFAGGVVLGRF
jgi:hypothetical protein